MRDGLTPSALLFAALGLVLAITPRTSWAPSLAALVTTLVCVAFLPVAHPWLDDAFQGCWISVLVTAGTVQVFRSIPTSAALLLSINTAVWASAVTTLSGSRSEVFSTLPWVLILLPASWLIRRHGSIPIRVMSSWLIAIAALSSLLQWLPVTPGYLPDHLE